MFSTLQKQKKAEELIDEARRIIEETDEKSVLEKERLEKSVAEADNFRNHLARKTLKKFHDLFFKIKGAEPIEMADIPERPFASQLYELTEQLDEVEPVEIAAAKRGKLKAVAASLAAALITVAIALVVALIATGTSLDPQTLTDPQTLQKLLVWIGGGAFGYPAASAVWGAAALAAAAVAAVLIIWSLLMAKSSGRNLAEAQNSHADAENYRDRKEHYISAMQKLNDEISQFKEILETFDIFLQEYNASIRRILYTEGREFENYKERSKKTVSRAAACAQALVPILDITITTSDGQPSKQLFEALEKGKSFREALINEEELPDNEDRVYEHTGEPHSSEAEPAQPEKEEEHPLAIDEKPTR